MTNNADKFTKLCVLNKSTMNKYLVVALMTILVACGGTKTEETQVEVLASGPDVSHHSASITKVFNAHGGFDTWDKMNQLSYKIGEQTTLVELHNRYTRLESPEMTVGFDGDKVWVNPPSENADGQRMRYNLMFYFYAFPFVIGDPGITYEDVEPKEFMGTTYNGVKVSYGDGVGDSPKDNYIVYSNPETNKMEWLMYTATFGGGDASDRYALIKYDEWQTLNGVTIPKALKWYQYKDGKVGEERFGRTFENVAVSEEMPAMEKFTMPEGAQVAADPSK